MTPEALKRLSDYLDAMEAQRLRDEALFREIDSKLKELQDFQETVHCIAVVLGVVVAAFAVGAILDAMMRPLVVS
jgi:hypothetical protein